MIDSNNLPISGGVLMTGLLYVATSVFITGPLVAQRTIEYENSHQMCVAQIQKQLPETQPETNGLPDIDCGILSKALSPELGQLCNAYEDSPLGQLIDSVMGGVSAQKEMLRAKRLQAIANKTKNQCKCAISIATRETYWSIYAGSARLITPPEVSALPSTIYKAAQSPYCRGGAS